MNKPTEPKVKQQSAEKEALTLTLYSLLGVVAILVAIYFMTLQAQYQSFMDCQPGAAKFIINKTELQVGFSLIVGFGTGSYSSCMPIRFSVLHDLPPVGWGSVELSSYSSPGWTGIVNMMRVMWDAGKDTQLTTAYFHPLDQKSLSIDKQPVLYKLSTDDCALCSRKRSSSTICHNAAPS